MPTLNETLACLQDLKTAILTDVAGKKAIAGDMKALLVNRLQQQRVDGALSAFKPYAMSTKRQRSRDGYQIDAVDFTQTNSMLGGLTEQVNNDQNGVITVNIVADTPENEKKLANNVRLRPTMLDLSEAEIEIGRQLNESRVQTLINECLN